MCKQKLISNKFDLNLTTTLSSYLDANNIITNDIQMSLNQMTQQRNVIKSTNVVKANVSRTNVISTIVNNAIAISTNVTIEQPIFDRHAGSCHRCLINTGVEKMNYI